MSPQVLGPKRKAEREARLRFKSGRANRGPAAGVRLRVRDRRRVFIVNPQARRGERHTAQILHVRVPLPDERREAPGVRRPRPL